MWSASWETCMQVKKLELDMEQQIGFKLGKDYVKAVYCHPALFNLYAEYIMWNAGLDKTQAGIKIARGNINNLRYEDDITLMAKKQRIKELLDGSERRMKKFGLKLDIQKTKIMASSPITSWQIDGETMETGIDFYFGGLQNHCRRWLQPWN